MKPNESLLETLLELQALDRIPRMGYLLRGITDPESVSEHSWHLVFLVWTLAPQCVGVDPLRSMELAMIHDVAEVRTGDLPSTAARYLPEGAKVSAEANAMIELLAPLGSRARDLCTEYLAAETPEARFVKACDKLQMMLKVHQYEVWGAGGLEGFWRNPGNFPTAEFPAVERLFEELRRRADSRLLKSPGAP